jgi:SH3-like domain-containing protein
VPRINWVSLACRAALGAFVLALCQTAEPLVSQASAQAVGPNKSGLPIPRFVTLKSGRVNLRVGPGRNYPVEWMYLKSGLPVEIIQEYDNWRRIRDSEGTEGWINQSLLSGKRSGIAAPWFKGKEASITLTREPDEKVAADRHCRAGRDRHDRTMRRPLVRDALRQLFWICPAGTDLGRLSRRNIRRLIAGRFAQSGSAFRAQPDDDVDIGDFHARRRFWHVVTRTPPVSMSSTRFSPST